MKFPHIIFLAALLPACTQTPEQRAQVLVSADIQAHFSRAADYHAGQFTTRPYSRYDSLVYLARMAARNAAGPGTRPAVVLPPRRPQDSARIGTFVHHLYHAPDGDGNSRLDSADYLVYKGQDRAVELIQLKIKSQ